LKKNFYGLTPGGICLKYFIQGHSGYFTGAYIYICVKG
jgi:hypothetical protein